MFDLNLQSQHIDRREWIIAPHGQIIGQPLLSLMEFCRIDSSKSGRSFGRIDLWLEPAFPLRLHVFLPVVEMVVMHMDHFRLFHHTLVSQCNLFVCVTQFSTSFFQMFCFVVHRRIVRFVFRILLRWVFLSYLPCWLYTV